MKTLRTLSLATIATLLLACTLQADDQTKALSDAIIHRGCVYDGPYGGPSRYPGPYRSGGYYYGGIHRGYSYGLQHGFGRSGFGQGGFGGGSGGR